MVRRHFAFGTGHLIFRSIAQKFEQFAEEFRKQETRCLEAVARNEANGRPLAAARMRQEAAKKGAEAAAMNAPGFLQEGQSWAKPNSSLLRDQQQMMRGAVVPTSLSCSLLWFGVDFVGGGLCCYHTAAPMALAWVPLIGDFLPGATFTQLSFTCFDVLDLLAAQFVGSYVDSEAATVLTAGASASSSGDVALPLL